MATQFDIAYEIIRNKIDPELEQRPDLTPKQLTDFLFDAMRVGRCKILVNQDRRVVHVIVLRNQYVGDVHLFADTKTPWDIVVSHNQFLNWVFEKKPVKKIEARTIFPALSKMMKRAGWVYEGTRYKSLWSKGKMNSVDLYGLVLEEHYE